MKTRTPRPWSAVPIEMREWERGSRTVPLTLRDVERFFPAAVVVWDHCAGCAWDGVYFRLERVRHPVVARELERLDATIAVLEAQGATDDVELRGLRVWRRATAVDDRAVVVDGVAWSPQTDLIAYRADHIGQATGERMRWSCVGAWEPVSR